MVRVQQTASFGNTKLYGAPEVLDEEGKRGRSAGIFSLGCVLLEIYSVARQPFVIDFFSFIGWLGMGNPSFGALSQEGLLEWMTCTTSNDIPGLKEEEAILRRMVAHDPDQRPSAEEVSLNLKCMPCKHGDKPYEKVYWPAEVGDEAGGEVKRVS